MANFVLASASPRRLELLRQLGLEPLVEPVELDESPLPGELPGDLVQRLAEVKAAACMQRRCDAGAESLPVMAADTLVVLEGEVLGKPSGRDEALAWLARMSGHWHEVLTAVVVDSEQGLRQGLSVSRVRFRHISKAEALAYWDTGEPADKAGAYGIQGRGAIFVDRLEGSYSGVVGLPLAETAALLAELGIKVIGER